MAPFGRHRTAGETKTPPREQRTKKPRHEIESDARKDFPNEKDHAVVGGALRVRSKHHAGRDGPEPAGVTWTRSAIAPASITTLPTVIAEVNGGGLAVEDVDGDGDEDLLVATPGTMNSSGSLTLYRNQGRGQFAADPAVGLELANGWLTGLATADFDQDGHLDVVVGRLGTDLLLRGTPEGFNPPPNSRDWDGPPAWPRPISTAMATAISFGCSTWNLTPRLLRRPRPTRALKCWADRTG